ncbi:NmrA family NAD(P)-binding protein [Dyadobacter sp. LHD-138]|nr:NmrA family NAD(P)-binding protein [Dyadobacter sp. LHD-138]MDQ6480003.1 NmrA family NAD(P)-binding protein [Dyadobacter sp. LHD-138]
MVKLSQWAAAVDSPVRFLRYHAVVENLIRASGIPYTFLRPNLFMQGLLGFRETIMQEGQFYGAVGDAKISLIDIRDIAAAAGEALTQPEHEGKTYNLTGPESLTHQQLAEKLSTATNHHIQFIDITPDLFREALLQVGFPHWQAEGLIEDYAHYKLGEAAAVHTGVTEVTGKTPINFERFAKDYAFLFSA